MAKRTGKQVERPPNKASSESRRVDLARYEFTADSCYVSSVGNFVSFTTGEHETVFVHVPFVMLRRAVDEAESIVGGPWWWRWVFRR